MANLGTLIEILSREQMEKAKHTFSGETLEMLKKLSPRIRALAGDKTSVEIKAEDFFKYVKKQKTPKEKLYLFVKAVLPEDGQPLFIKKKVGVEVRSNWSSKSEIESILQEAGITDTKFIFQRAKDFVEGKEKAKIAETIPQAKGKPEHATTSRAPRSTRRRHLNRKFNNDPSNNNNDEPTNEDLRRAWDEARNREPTAEEKRRHAAWIKYHQEREKIIEELLRSHRVNAPKAWKEMFPDKRYPPEEPGWHWEYPPGKWTYIKPSTTDPFTNPYWNNYNQSGRPYEPGASYAPRYSYASSSSSYASSSSSSSSQQARPPPAPSPQANCEQYLLSLGITDKKSFWRWAMKNHPDKAQQEAVEAGLSKQNADKRIDAATALFKNASSCVDKVKADQNKGDDWHLGPNKGGTRKRKSKKRGTRRV